MGWTWQVNITDVIVPDSFLSNRTNGSQVLNEQWSLQWPGGGSWESFHERDSPSTNGTSFEMHVVQYYLPSNITSRYSQSDNGNCSAVIGDECAQRLLARQLGSGSLNSPSETCADTLAVGTAVAFTYSECHIHRPHILCSIH
jgi:hypothetical protein